MFICVDIYLFLFVHCVVWIRFDFGWTLNERWSLCCSANSYIIQHANKTKTHKLSFKWIEWSGLRANGSSHWIIIWKIVKWISQRACYSLSILIRWRINESKSIGIMNMFNTQLTCESCSRKILNSVHYEPW